MVENSKPFVCSYCDKSFNYKSCFKNHVKVCTGLSCGTCSKAFSDKYVLETHIKKVHLAQRNYSCTTCSKSFKDPYCLKRHELSHIDIDRPFHCLICEKTFKTKQDLMSHYSVHSDLRPYECSVCDKTFKTTGSLSEHKKKHHEPVTIFHNCKTCDKSFADKSSLSRHEKIHTGEKPFKCNICEKAFLLKFMRDVHEKTHDDSLNHICNLCYKAFKSADGLNYHLKTHNYDESRMFKCQFCPKHFILKSQRKIHERCHTGVKPFKCLSCDKKFGDSSALNKHKKRGCKNNEEAKYCDSKWIEDNQSEKKPIAVNKTYGMQHELTDIKPFNCLSYDKKFRDSSALYKHEKKGCKSNEEAKYCDSKWIEDSQHEEKPIAVNGMQPELEKKHDCGLCGKLFHTQRSLAIHMGHHTRTDPASMRNPKTENKPKGREEDKLKYSDSRYKFSCSICYQTFDRQNSLEKHLNVKHEPKQTWSCNVCSKNFPCISWLQRHMKVHDVKSLCCDICNIVFESNKSLAIHKGHHSRKNKVKVQKGQKEDKFLVKEEFSDSDETAKEDGETETNSCLGDVSGADIKKENKELTKFDLDIKEELEEFDDSIFDILLP